jgi:AcrR family transcriptional regulator
MKVVAERGFDATVDEIARESGVSPRTIFRHYTTQSSLIVATVKDMFVACGRRPIDGLPAVDDDLDGWLDVLAVTIHTRNAEIIGEAFWDIHAPTLEESEALAELARLRREWRRGGVRRLAAMAWTAAGGPGEPPDGLVAAFALNFSVFATQALMIDFDRTPQEIGVLTAGIVKTFLWRELREHRGDSAVSLTLVGDESAAGSPPPPAGTSPRPSGSFPTGEVRTAEE